MQFKGRFILTSVKSGLMLIDQHRAHIRVLFDRYMVQIQQKQGVSQGVLFPEILQLPASEAAVLQGIMDDLSAVGFDLSDLGGGSYAINGIPSGIEGSESGGAGAEYAAYGDGKREVTSRRKSRSILSINTGTRGGYCLRTGVE